MAKTALITGVTGQDGAYLARLLLGKGYRVFGTERAQQPTERARLDWLGVGQDLTIVQLELTDSGQIQRVLDRVAPDEIYNLAAQSFVHASFEQPIYAGEVTGLAVARILEALRNSHAKARFYQASTSELFGNARVSPQDENTPFHPRSPYAIAKLYGHHIAVNYREAYGLHTSCGILFNHESPLRPPQFITRKVTLAFARMAAGQPVTLEVGNLEAGARLGLRRRLRRRHVAHGPAGQGRGLRARHRCCPYRAPAHRDGRRLASAGRSNGAAAEPRPKASIGKPEACWSGSTPPSIARPISP